MSRDGGWAALNLEMPARIPRTEFDAETYRFDLMREVTGTGVGPDSPPETKQRATQAFIRAEVERCLAVGRACPGYFLSITHMIPPNTPVEAALYYNEVYESLCRR